MPNPRNFEQHYAQPGGIEAEYNAQAETQGYFSVNQIIAFNGNPDNLSDYTINTIIRSVEHNFEELQRGPDRNLQDILVGFGIITFRIEFEPQMERFSERHLYSGRYNRQIRITDVVRRERGFNPYQPFYQTEAPMPTPQPVIQPADFTFEYIEQPSSTNTPFPASYEGTLQQELGTSENRILINRQLNLINAVKNLANSSRTDVELMLRAISKVFGDITTQTNGDYNRVRAIVINPTPESSDLIVESVTHLNELFAGANIDCSIAPFTRDGFLYKLRINFHSEYEGMRTSKDIFFISAYAARDANPSILSRAIGNTVTVYFHESVDEVTKYCFSTYLNGRGTGIESFYVQRWLLATSRVGTGQQRGPVAATVQQPSRPSPRYVATTTNTISFNTVTTTNTFANMFRTT